MKYLKLSSLAVIIGVGLLITGATALAASFPVSGIDVYLKSVQTKLVISAKTDEQGNFNATVPEESGIFDLFINDESAPAVKITAKKGMVSGHIVILTDENAVKNTTPAKKSVPAPKPAAVKKSPVPKKSAPKNSATPFRIPMKSNTSTNTTSDII